MIYDDKYISIRIVIQQFVFDLSRYIFEEQSLIEGEDVVEVYRRILLVGMQNG